MHGMPSSDRLEWPAEWPAHEGARYKFSLAFVAVLGLMCIPVGYGFVAIGRPSAIKYVILFAVSCWLIAAFSYITRVRPQHREGDIALTSYDGRPATEIRYSLAQFVLLAVLTVCLVVLCALASWDFAFAGEEVPAAPVAATLCGLAAVFFFSFFVLVARGRLRRGRIVLAPQGVYQEGRVFSSFLPRESFVGAKAAYNGTREILVVAYTNAPWEKHQLRKAWKLDRLPPVPMVEIDTFHLAVDANLVYHLVMFYMEYPTARAELGTEASLQRARTGTFE